MNTNQAEKLFAQEFAKQNPPKCGGVTTEGKAHDVQLFSREFSGTGTDAELDTWIKESSADLAKFERAQLRAIMALLEAKGIKDIDSGSVRVVRRMPPAITRTRNEFGELCWRIAARVGTRVEPYPKRDPRSSRARAIEDAKLLEQEQIPKTASQLLEELP
jgi:hypothetical protein